MKIFSHFLALCLLQAWGSAAFSIKPHAASFATKLSATPEFELPAAAPSDWFELFPSTNFPAFDRIEGGGTVRTYPMPPWTERVQIMLKTNGRPMKAQCELWIGPIRRVHLMQIDNQDGSETPYRATLKFRKVAPVLQISTPDTLEYPLLASVFVPPPERAEEIDAFTTKTFDNATPDQKLIVQGGSTSGGGGSIRSWTIPDNVESVQFLGWAKDVGKKSFRVKLEVLQGPNNNKQDYMLQCGGGTQPYHAVFQTPGSGWRIRVKNLKYVEDGKVQFAVLPYKTVDGGPAQLIGTGDTGSDAPGPAWSTGPGGARPSDMGSGRPWYQ